MIRFRIPDMTCGGCIASLTKAVKATDPSASLSADLDTHIVEITSLRDAATLATAMADAGFTPSMLDQTPA